jgi:hypothetical protein
VTVRLTFTGEHKGKSVHFGGRTQETFVTFVITAVGAFRPNYCSHSLNTRSAAALEVGNSRRSW